MENLLWQPLMRKSRKKKKTVCYEFIIVLFQDVMQADPQHQIKSNQVYLVTHIINSMYISLKVM